VGKINKRAKDQLTDIGVRPSKQRGQNFIIDESVLDSIVEFGAPNATQSIVEIGPGLAALTKRLAVYGSKLSVIEIEPKFCQAISSEMPKVEIFNADVRSFDFSKIGKDLVVFGNLPYSYSTEIIFHLLDQHSSISKAVLMLQREFAERVAAAPGSRTYGVLSVMTQIRADMRLGPVISGDSFHPKANVESRLLELKMLAEPRFNVKDLVWFRKVVQAAFLQRRKKLKNSLKSSGIFANEEALDDALKRAQISPDIRAEKLSVEDFARLAKFN
jgi:16S rRNA (adenine1518-N6/adenine1519-N6)-dimethyltransferase